MEDPQLLSGSESNLSDSWTLLNGDAAEQENGNEELDETSDAESLEVLEVERADSDQTPVDDSINKCEQHQEGDINESDGSQMEDIPVFQIIATQKTRKYVHHPNPYVNMWLSIMMVIAIAITLGLGMGHYLGTKRFSKASDIIQHLQCKNHMLEMELGRLATKHKVCERNLHETENIFNILMNGSQNEFLKEEQTTPEDNPRKTSNATTLSPKQSSCERGSVASSCHLAFINNNFNDAFRIKGDELIKNSYFSMRKLEAISENIFSPKLQMSFVMLNDKLNSLRFLLKKWSQHVNESKLKYIVEGRNGSDCKDHLLTAEIPRNISCKVNSQINEEKCGNEILNNDRKLSLHNHCCRSPISVNKRLEGKYHLKTEGKILSRSLFYVSFKQSKPFNLSNFHGIGNESMKYNFVSARNKWGSSVNKIQDTFKVEDCNRGDHKTRSRSCKGKKKYEGKDLRSNFGRHVLYKHKNHLIDESNARVLFQNHKMKRNNKNFKKSYSVRSNFKYSQVEHENPSNKIKNRKWKRTVSEKLYNEIQNGNGGKKNSNNAPYFKTKKFENQNVKHNYKHHPFARKENCWNKNDHSKYKHSKIKGNYHRSHNIPIKKYFQKKYEKEKNFYKIDHKLYSGKRTKDSKLNYFKDKPKFHGSAYSFKYKYYKDEKSYGKKFDIFKVEKDKSFLKKRKLNQLEFKSMKVFKY